jgi:porphyrinogen peroxidase
MSKPQAGIVAENRNFAIFLVCEAKDTSASRALAKTAAGLPRLLAKLARQDPGAELMCTVGFGAAFWEAVSPVAKPRELRPFRTIQAGAFTAPATGGDFFFHICSHRHDLNLDAARAVLQAFAGKLKVLEEVPGFTYRDSRDLTGFIDGTANPQGEERAEAALIGPEDSAFTGGSYALVQRYVHRLAEWERLDPAAQEKIVGRTKGDSQELPADQKPESSHIARAELREGEHEFKIVRHSLPYGTASGDSGLLFLAYAKDPGIFERQLQRMLGAAGDGEHDRLMEFSHAVSGAFFFMPSLEKLAELGD